VLLELGLRGVEAIGYVVGLEWADGEEGRHSSPPLAEPKRPLTRQAVTTPKERELVMPAQSAALRGVVLSCSHKADAVHGRLDREIVRHGPFVDPETALDFVVDVLQRAERRLETEPARAVGGAPRRRRSGGGPVVLATGEGASVPGPRTEP
jgi:hypothetical protein